MVRESASVILSPAKLRPVPSALGTRVAAMKKLINDPNDVVAEALIGIEAARPEIRVDHANRIIYRRDAANSAPDRVTVRVIAKVVRAMTFDTTGQAKTTDVEDSWTIRNLSYEFRVAPLGEGSEMLVLRPVIPDFMFPAGRYGLVIKGQAYDFTVAGRITEAAQCLENVKAANGTFYSECRQQNAKQL